MILIPSVQSIMQLRMRTVNSCVYYKYYNNKQTSKYITLQMILIPSVQTTE